MARVHYRVDPERKYILHDPDNMPDRPFPGGDMEHMLSMASIQLALLRHADRVKIGCMTGGLFALCASNHDTVWRTASHYCFMALLELARGTSMQVKVDSETFDLPGYAIDDTSQYTGKDGIPYIDSASAWDTEKGVLTVFIINRNESENYPVTIDLRGFDGKLTRTAESSAASVPVTFTFEHTEISSEDLSIVTQPDHDTLFAPKAVSDAEFSDRLFHTHVKPLSWNVIKFTV
jgi:alpha-N-arabinofuranosidase